MSTDPKPATVKSFIIPAAASAILVVLMVVALAEQCHSQSPALPAPVSERERREADEALRILCEGKRVIEYLAGARVPMPKTTAAYHRRCDAFRESIART